MFNAIADCVAIMCTKRNTFLISNSLSYTINIAFTKVHSYPLNHESINSPWMQDKFLLSTPNNKPTEAACR